LSSVASSVKDDAVKTYSLDLRERVLKDMDAGLTTSAVAAKYSVSPAWLRRLKQRRAATGEIGPKPQRRGSIPAAVTYAEQIREAVRQAPDATLDEYRKRLNWPMSRSTLANALLALGLTRKKRRSRRASRIAPM
jgi:transposase